MSYNIDNRPAQTQNESTTRPQLTELLQTTQLCGVSLSVYGTPAEPLFLAKEVADAIDHSDVSTMMRSVDDDEKLTQTLFASGQRREMWMLTEYGLYEVLMQSRKPIARQFKRGVKELLRNIRTGATTENHLSNSFIRKTTRLLESAEDRIDRLNAKVKALSTELAVYHERETQTKLRPAERYEGFAEWRALMQEMLRPEDKRRVASEGGWTLGHVYRVLSGATVSTPVTNALSAVARENNERGIRAWMSRQAFSPQYVCNLFDPELLDVAPLNRK